MAHLRLSRLADVLSLSLLTVTAAWASGCVGTIAPAGQEGESAPGRRDAPPAPEPIPAPTSFACSEDDPRPLDRPLRRLSTPEYARTLTDLLTATGTEEVTGMILDEVSGALQAVPGGGVGELVDGPAGPTEARFVRLVQAVSQSRVDRYRDVALAVGQAIVADDRRLEAYAGSCAVDADVSNDRACLDAFIDRFATRAFRAPLARDERDFLRSDGYIDGDVLTREGLAELVAVILLAPRFLYHFEVGDEVGGGEVILDDFSLAARLSYHFLGSMPDAELWEAAESGSLQTDAGYAAQVDRLASHPGAREQLASFITEWLGVAELPALDAGKGDPRFDAFFGDHAPSETLHEAMVDELARFAAYQVFDNRGTLADLFQGNEGFPATEELAAIYGVEPWVPGADPVSLPPEERAGILTRPALLAQPSVEPHPILRGVLINKHVLCRELPAPPADISTPELDPTMSSRQMAEEITAPDACQGCHQLINPPGFALGHYDALGRYIDEEPRLDDEGRLLAQPVVEAQAQMLIEGGSVDVAGGVELSAALSESPEVEACFARQVFRFTHRRIEDATLDGCSLGRIQRVLREGGSMFDALREAALDPEFRRRRTSGGE